MRPLFIRSIGVISAALPSWNRAAAILRGEDSPCTEPLLSLKPELLKANERRRTTNTIKLALRAAQDLALNHPLDGDINTVFASSEGDLDIVDGICRALTMPDKPVSPTQFHNSVHNAPAGYWSIATGCRGASISIGGLNGSFASGLLESATQTSVSGSPTLLVSYDWPAPAAMSSCFDRVTPFAVALLLSPEKKEAIAQIQVNTQPSGSLSTLSDERLEQLRKESPAARCLPLLHALACGSGKQILLPYLPALHLSVEVEPCC